MNILWNSRNHGTTNITRNTHLLGGGNFYVECVVLVNRNK